MHLFDHGDMNLPHKALEIFLLHARAANVLNKELSLPHLKVSGDFNVLELGPGDSLFTCVVAKALGAPHTWLVDVGSFATTKMAAYDEMLEMLRQRGFILSFENEPNTVVSLLKECNGEYLTEGIHSLAHVPSGSVDLCFSNMVFQYVPKS